jgi:CRISPR/Cas system-associated exonuclease Cas4 (RecB family)
VGASVIGLILLILAVVALLLWLNLRRRETGLTEGEIVYEAAGTTRIDDALVSPRYKLVGRPDYVVRMSRGLLPVEVKSRPCRRGPYDGEKAQLFAYCLLVEETMGAPVRSGVLRYADRELVISFGERERAWVLGLLAQMQQSRHLSEVARSHSHVSRCQRCGVRARCGQALA